MLRPSKHPFLSGENQKAEFLPHVNGTFCNPKQNPEIKFEKEKETDEKPSFQTIRRESGKGLLMLGDGDLLARKLCFLKSKFDLVSV